MDAMKGWLESEHYLKIFSLLLALTIWFMAVNQGEQVVNTRLQEFQVETALLLTPEVREMGEGLVLASELPQVRVTVRISGPSAVAEGTAVGDSVKAYINVAGLTAGVHTIDVKCQVAQAGVKVVKVEPPRVVVNLQRLVLQKVPLSVGFINPPLPARGEDPSGDKAGLYWEGRGVGDVELEPAVVTIEGPRDLINRVKDAMVLIKSSSGEGETLPVLLLDEKGETVKGVKVVPQGVRVILPATSKGEAKNEKGLTYIDPGKNKGDKDKYEIVEEGGAKKGKEEDISRGDEPL